MQRFHSVFASLSTDSILYDYRQWVRSHINRCDRSEFRHWSNATSRLHYCEAAFIDFVSRSVFSTTEGHGTIDTAVDFGIEMFANASFSKGCSCGSASSTGAWMNFIAQFSISCDHWSQILGLRSSCQAFVTDSDSTYFISVGRQNPCFTQIQSKTVLHVVIISLLDKLLQINFVMKR